MSALPVGLRVAPDMVSFGGLLSLPPLPPEVFEFVTLYQGGQEEATIFV